MDEQKLKDRQFSMGQTTLLRRALDSVSSSFSASLKDLKQSLVSQDLRPLLKELSTKIFSVKVTNPTDLTPLKTAIEADKTSEVVKETSQNIIKALESVENGIKSIVIPESKEANFKPVIEALANVQKQIAAIKIPEPKEVKFPKPEKIVIPSEMSIKESREILKALADVRVAIASIKYPEITIPKQQQMDLTELLRSLEAIKSVIENQPKPEKLEFPATLPVHIMGTEVPQKVPQPVTNFNLNPLRGIVHSTSTTVSTNLTQLPGYGVLTNRRSVIFFNNSGSTTVYIGGSDVTANNGLPVLAQSYSPAIDSGPLQRWYGVTTSGSADMRCIEIANDSGT